MATSTGKYIKIGIEDSEGAVHDITSGVSAFCYEPPKSTETYFLPHADFTIELKADEDTPPAIFRDNRLIGVEIKPEFWFLDTFRFESGVNTCTVDSTGFSVNMTVNDGTWKAEETPGKLAAGLRWLWRFGWFRWLLRLFR